MKRCLISTLLSLTVLSIGAYSPGGVSGVAAWFMTDTVPGTDGNKYRWHDLSGNGLTLRNARGEVQVSHQDTAYINFNPVLTFHLNGGTEQDTINHTEIKDCDLTQATVIGVFSAPKVINNAPDHPQQIVYSLRDGHGRYVTLLTDAVLYTGRPSSIGYGSGKADLRYTNGEDPETFNTDYTKIITLYKSDVPETGVWGADDATLSMGTVQTKGVGGLTSNIPGATYGMFKGSCPELCVFPRLLTPLERRQAESYLAMRYGLTLDGSYLDPDGNIIWDIDGNAYHHRVTAIARDVPGAFRQDKSATTHRSGASGTGDGFLLTVGTESAGGLPDGTWIIWGDDGGTLTDEHESAGETGQDATPIPADESPWHVMKRKWTVLKHLRQSMTEDFQQEAAARDAASAEPPSTLCQVQMDGVPWPWSHKEGIRAYLCIDRGGTADIDPETADTVRYSRAEAKGKTIYFNNVELDTDGSGSDSFTLAYWDGMKAHVEASPATCHDGESRSDGKITIKMIEGLSPYSLELTRTGGSAQSQIPAGTVRRETFRGDSHTVRYLAPGTYTLTLVQKGGIRPRMRTYDIEIGSECDPGSQTCVTETTPQTSVTGHERKGSRSRAADDGMSGTDIPGPDGKAVLTVVRVTDQRLTFRAELTLDADTPATLAVYDSSGRLVHSVETSGGDSRSERFTVPAPGVYIVKAFTPRGEHTCRIIAG